MDTINNVAYLYKDGPITVIINGTETYVIPVDHMNYEEICEVLFSEDPDYTGFREILSVSKAIDNFGQGQVKVVDGELTFGDIVIHNSLAERIIRMHREGFTITPMVNFLTNLMENPSKRAVDELYGFLEYGDLPLTPEGHFLAYKVVRSDYTDKHSGQFDNSVGADVSMPRNQVNDNKEETCSTGLHFCSREYAEGMFGQSGDRMVVVQINPRDVVSIPVDYNNTKGRCAGYKVVGELSFKDAKVSEKEYLEGNTPVNEVYYTQKEVDELVSDAYNNGYDDRDSGF